MAKKTAKKKSSKKSGKFNKPENNWLEKDTDPNPKPKKKAPAKKKTATKKAPVKKVKKEETEEGEHSNVVPQKFREKYKEHNGSCGDDLSTVLRKATDSLEKEAKAAKLVEIGNDNELNVTKRWGHLNSGMQRMNLGNVLRGRIAKGERVKVGSKVWKAVKAA